MTSEYELALVVNAKIEDAERAAVVDKAKGYIERFGGKIGEIEEWGKRKLAYEIQKMDEAYYYFIPFTAEPDCPNELEKRMRIMDNVLRYLIVRQDGEDEFHLNVSDESANEAAAPAEEAAAPAEAAQASEAAAETAPAAEEAASDAAGEAETEPETKNTTEA
jgi:small subunit ribosomal protein S6